MKTKIIILTSVFNCFVLLPGHAQWYVLDTITATNYPPNFLFQDVRFADNGIAYKFYTYDPPTPSTPATMRMDKTADDCQSWYSLIDLYDYSYRSYDLEFVSADTGFFCYNYMAQIGIIKTSDGGSTWPTGMGNSGMDLFFINGLKGYSMTGNEFHRYENDALTYVNVITFTNVASPVFFFSKNGFGYIIAGESTNVPRQKILKTVDDGNTWTLSLVDSSRKFYDLYFPSDSVGYVLCDSGRIYKTIDAGNTWQLSVSGSTNLNKIYFLNNDTGYVAGSSGLIMRTNDGGSIWQQQTGAPSNFNPKYIKIFNDTTGYLVGTITGSNGFIAEIALKNSPRLVSYKNYPELMNKKILLIIPNPNTGKCNITVPDEFSKEENLTLRIFDNTGKLIQEQTVEMYEDKVKVNLEAEAKGIYNVTLSNNPSAGGTLSLPKGSGRRKKSYAGKIIFE